MTDLKEIPINQIPYCIQLVEFNMGLRQWLEILNEQTSHQNFAPVDDFFTEDDFNFARKQSWGIDLKRFNNFSQFSEFLVDYVRSQLCGNKCPDEVPLAEELKRLPDQGPQFFEVCPDKPDLPELPKDKPPPKPKKPIAPAPDLVQTLPKWKAPSSNEKQRPTPLAKLSPEIAVGVSDPLETARKNNVYEAPDKSVGEVKISIRFDGKDVIIDLHGCYVELSAYQCLQDWPLFWLRLENISSKQNSQSRADEEGWARIRVKAKSGEILKFFAIDSFNGCHSLNELWFMIDPNGKPRFLKNLELAGEDHPIRNYLKAVALPLLLPFIAPLAYGKSLEHLKGAFTNSPEKKLKQTVEDAKPFPPQPIPLSLP